MTRSLRPRRSWSLGWFINLNSSPIAIVHRTAYCNPPASTRARYTIGAVTDPESRWRPLRLHKGVPDMEKRGRESTLANAEGFLRQLSALELLNRLPTAIIGVGPLGDIAYANPAFAEMLGYINDTTVTRVQLPSVLIGHEALTPCDCLRTLKTADSAVEWRHSQGYAIRTMVSSPLLVRETDTLMLIEVVDVTAWLWDTSRRTDASRICRQLAL